MFKFFDSFHILISKMADQKIMFKIAKDDEGDIHIYQAKNDQEICFKKVAFERLLELIPKIEEAVEEKRKEKWSLDGDWYCHSSLFTLPKKRKPKYLFKRNKGETEEEEEEEADETENIMVVVNVRRWFYIDDYHMPTKDGIAITENCWKYLMEAIDEYRTNERANPDDTPMKRKQTNSKKRSGDSLDYVSKKKNTTTKTFIG